MFVAGFLVANKPYLPQVWPSTRLTFLIDILPGGFFFYGIRKISKKDLGGGNSNIFHFHPYLGGWSKLTTIFFRWVETTNCRDIFFFPERLGLIDSIPRLDGWKVGDSPKKTSFFEAEIEKVVGSQFTLRELWSRTLLFSVECFMMVLLEIRSCWFHQGAGENSGDFRCSPTNFITGEIVRKTFTWANEKKGSKTVV